MSRAIIRINIVLIILICISCGKEPEPINYGRDNCEHCRMLISDSNYGAELITQKGKIFKFDSIECLAAYSTELPAGNIHSMWVTQFGNPNKLINSNTAQFMKSKQLKSPMGLNLSAYENESVMNEMHVKFDGEKITWEGIKVLVNNEWN